MTNPNELIAEYVERISPLLELAKRAFGPRNAVSPEHDASREYTRLLCEFYDRKGSLPGLARELGVTYAGMRRRITTASLEPSTGRARKKTPEHVYVQAVVEIGAARNISTEDYHKAVYKWYKNGLSMVKLANRLGISSSNPLYYAINKIRLNDTDSEQHVE